MAITLFSVPGRGRLPHPAVPTQVLRVVEKAVVTAWELIRATPPSGFNLTSAEEKTITAVLHNTLVNRVLYAGVVPGFTPALFRVSPDPKVYSFDGKNLDKMPDLFFHLISDRTVTFPDQDGLFAECKPIDANHAVGGCYCDKGISRFVNGEYAWAMREAMMIAYAVQGYSLPDDLKTPLSQRDRPTKLPLTSGPSRAVGTLTTILAQPRHVTVHARNFKYPSSGRAAPEITIHHLWLSTA